MPQPLIALDADGVLLDYHAGYAMAWQNAFGETLSVRDPQGYHPMQYWNVPQLSAEGQQHLRQYGFTEEVWSTMPALPGAVLACQQLRELGYRLECVTALPAKWQQARAVNLAQLGFELDAVHAVGIERHGADKVAGNPKRDCIAHLAPAFFVDDYLAYFQGVPTGVWRALIDVRPNGSPNHDPALEPPHSRHPSLLAFALWRMRQQR
jgi:phosphoglycolate phosphatase-like HAD superfamily hydrolase